MPVLLAVHYICECNQIFSIPGPFSIVSIRVMMLMPIYFFSHVNYFGLNSLYILCCHFDCPFPYAISFIVKSVLHSRLMSEIFYCVFVQKMSCKHIAQIPILKDQNFLLVFISLSLCMSPKSRVATSTNCATSEVLFPFCHCDLHYYPA